MGVINVFINPWELSNHNIADFKYLIICGEKENKRRTF